MQRSHDLHAGQRPLPQGEAGFGVFRVQRHHYPRLASAITGFESNREFMVDYQAEKSEEIRHPNL